MVGLPAPVLNRQYVFKITDGGSVWFYSIKDLTTNIVYEWTATNHSTGYGTEVWWGTEVTYTSSAQGTNQGSPDLFMRRLQYHPVGFLVDRDAAGSSLRNPYGWICLPELHATRRVVACVHGRELLPGRYAAEPHASPLGKRGTPCERAVSLPWSWPDF
jgi:hypothetical protein